MQWGAYTACTMDKLIDFSTNITTIDPFGPSALHPKDKEQITVGPRTTKIHVRTQQMGKRWLTMIEGLDPDLDQVRIARAIKQALHCAASVETSTDGEEYIKLSGNQRDVIRDWLVANEVLTEKEARERLVLHGA